MADLDAALVQQVLHIPQRQRVANVKITASRMISGLVLK